MNLNFRLLNVIALTVLVLSATTASADLTVTIDAVNLTTASTDLSLAADGDQVQIDIFVVNNGNVAGATLSVSTSDFDFNTGGAGLTIDAGSFTSASWFNTSLGKFNNPQGGITSIRGTSNGFDGPAGSYTSITLPNSLTNGDVINGALQIFSGLAADPGNPPGGSGEFDLGILDGGTSPGGTADVDFVSAGAAHTRVLFTVVGGGGTLDFGQGPNDGVVDPAGGVIISPASLQVPEPTSLSLGLSALASVFAVVGIRRRKA